jgi:uncharacterized protein (TIGR02596 family)
MNMPKPQDFRAASARHAYTLLELLAVMAIMALLLAILVPSLSGINESNNIVRGGQLFADQVGLARQVASSRNITIEVRCINIPIRSQYGYSGIQLWSPGGANSVPITRMQTLPDGIVISPDTTAVSSLFASYLLSGVMPAGSPAAGDNYVSFTINPSGMVGPLLTTTTAPNMTGLYIGVVPKRYAQLTALPANANYMLVQLNPITAATLTYRP